MIDTGSMDKANEPGFADSESGGLNDMTDDERADRRNRIKALNERSNNRVQDFIELVASMCADRTRARKARAVPALTRPLIDYDRVNEEQSRSC